MGLEPGSGGRAKGGATRPGSEWWLAGNADDRGIAVFTDRMRDAIISDILARHDQRGRANCWRSG